jgi:hypothetical protein
LSTNADLTINVPDIGPLSSAKTLLISKLPFEDCLIKMQADIIQSPNMIVTGYFRIPSKQSAEEYNEWMANTLSLQDAMVIFTDPDLVDHIKEWCKILQSNYCGLHRWQEKNPFRSTLPQFSIYQPPSASR